MFSHLSVRSALGFVVFGLLVTALQPMHTHAAQVLPAAKAAVPTAFSQSKHEGDGRHTFQRAATIPSAGMQLGARVVQSSKRGNGRARAGRVVRIIPSVQAHFREEGRLLDSWGIRLIDGDTFAYGGQRIRIAGIDAPEVSEAGGFEAAQRLDLLLHEGQVTIVPKAIDKYGRTIADVYVDQRDVARILASEGYGKNRWVRRPTSYIY